MSHEVVMPKMGESIVEGTIVEWKKNIGDFVKRDEILLEISTDKVDSEIPSPTEGTLLQILFNKNDVVEVGSVIALIGNKDSDLSSDSSKEEEEKNEKSKIPLKKNNILLRKKLVLKVLDYTQECRLLQLLNLQNAQGLLLHPFLIQHLTQLKVSLQ